MSAGFPESLTFRPSWRRRLARGFIEGLRIVLPLALVIATGYLIVVLVMPLAAENGWGLQVASALALAGCLYGLASFLLVVALKWILIGRYRPCARAMWTPFVWISEAVTNLYESLAVPNFLDFLRGTPMLPWALRLLGAKIGKGVYMNTTDLTEFDCVRIGDEAELNAWCGPQTHLFEDRVMKIGLVEIGAHTTIGAAHARFFTTRTLAMACNSGRSRSSPKANVCPPRRAGKVRPPRPPMKNESRAETFLLAGNARAAAAGRAGADSRCHRATAPDRAEGTAKSFAGDSRKWSGLSPEQLPLRETTRGPVWPGQLGGHSLDISLSYSGDAGWIGLIRAGQIGVDAMPVQPFPEAAAVARNYLGHTAASAIQQSTGSGDGLRRRLDEIRGPAQMPET